MPGRTGDAGIGGRHKGVENRAVGGFVKGGKCGDGRHAGECVLAGGIRGNAADRRQCLPDAAFACHPQAAQAHADRGRARR